jgi:hypothetical protein
MAQSYTRQSTFADGDTITASLFNNEYNQLENSFSYSSSNSSITGHRHDGTAGQGGNIFKIGDIDFLNKIEVDGTSNRWGIYVEVGGVSTEQVRVQDGSIVPVTNNDIDLGTSSLEFKDLFIDGTAHIDTLDIDENATVAGTLGVTGATTLSSTLAVTGTSTLTGNVTATNDLSIGGNLTVTGNATINGNLTFGDASTDTISFVADVNSSIIPEVDDTYDLGSPTQKWRNLYIDGVANIDSISGGTIDGSTIATSDITVGVGKTLDVSAGTLTLADNQISGDKVEGGTINATTINTLTYGSLSDGVITVTAFVDEDDMISNSATLVPTQQSVKTYVDTVVAATNEVVEDATPQLGGDLDLNSNNITGTGNINITGTIQSSGNITGTLATAAQGNVTSLGTLTSLGVSGDLTVDTNTLKVDSATNRVGILNVSPDVSLDIGSATDAVHVPVGTTAQRPGTPAAGYFRYNADLEQFEGYTDTWGAIGGGGTNTFTYDSFTGDGVTTNFVLSQATNLEGNLIVFIDGVFQTQDAYTISTASGITTLIFSVAPANTRKIVVYTIAAGVSGNNLNLDSFSGDGVLTDFTLSINAVSENNTQVYIDGVYQQKDGYTVTNTTLSFSSPPLNGSTIEVMTFTQTEVNVPVDNTITSAKLSGDLVTPGNLDVTGDIVLGDNNPTITMNDSSVANLQHLITSSSDNLIIAADNNDVDAGTEIQFYVDGAERMSVTATGIDVTGTVTADGLTVDGDGLLYSASNVEMRGDANVRISLGTAGTSGANNSSNWIYGNGTNLRFNNAGGYHSWETLGTERMRIDSSGNVGIGTSSLTGGNTILNLSRTGSGVGCNMQFANSHNGAFYVGLAGNTTGDVILHSADGSADMSFATGNLERMRIDSSGNLLVGKTVTTFSDVGTVVRSTGSATITRDGGDPLALNRKTSDGEILGFYKDGATVGSIGTTDSDLYIGTGDVGLWFQDGGNAIRPFRVDTGVGLDNSISLGVATSGRFDDAFITNGVTTGSDGNDKQDIETLSDAEQRVAVACKGLLRKWRWKDAVEAKGDDARIHFGIIAQDLQSAFEAEGLDAGRYAMFMSDTWTDEETGEERTRLGVRYHELLAFIIAAI